MNFKNIFGIYYYNIRIHKNLYKKSSVKIQIINETKKKYKIKLLDNTFNHVEGDIILVNKNKVKITKREFDDFWYDK